MMFIACFDTLGSEVMPDLDMTITLDDATTYEDVNALLDHLYTGDQYVDFTFGEAADGFFGDQKVEEYAFEEYLKRERV